RTGRNGPDATSRIQLTGSPAATSGLQGAVLDVERLAAAATILFVWIVEPETLVQPLANEVEFGAVEIRQALRVDQDLDAMGLELAVFGVNCARVFEVVRHDGRPGA